MDLGHSQHSKMKWFDESVEAAEVDYQPEFVGIPFRDCENPTKEDLPHSGLENPTVCHFPEKGKNLLRHPCMRRRVT